MTSEQIPNNGYVSRLPFHRRDRRHARVQWNKLDDVAGKLLNLPVQPDIAEDLTKNRLFYAMSGVFYPAGLGAGAISIVMKGNIWSLILHNSAYQLGIVIVLYFVASYVAFSKARKYGFVTFLLDVLDVGLMLWCFKLLQLLEFNSAFVVSNADLRTVHLIFALSVCTQIFWSKSAGLPPWRGIERRVLGLFALGIGYVNGGECDCAGRMVALSLVALILWHLLSDKAALQSAKQGGFGL